MESSLFLRKKFQNVHKDWMKNKTDYFFSSGGTSALRDLGHRKTTISLELQVVVKEKLQEICK
jgi:hypothetical protein